MRVVVLPEWYTSDDLSGNSQVSSTLALLKGCQAVEPTFAEFVLPVREGKMHWSDDLFDAPWIRTWEVDENYRNESWDHRPFGTPVMLPFRGGKVIVDLVLNMKQLHGGAVKLSTLGQPGQWTFLPEIPVVTYNTNSPLDEHLPAVRSRAGHAGMMSDALVGPVFVQGERERQAYLELAASYLAPAVVDGLDVRILKAAFEPLGPDLRHGLNGLRAARREVEGRVVAFHGGSFEAKRKTTQIALAVAIAKVAGVPIRLVLKTQATALSGREFPGAEIEMGVSHERYLQSFVDGDVVICADDYVGDGGTALSFMEAVDSGMLPVILAGPQQGSRLPAGYPLVARSWDEMPAALRLAATYYDALQREWSPRLIDKIGEWTGPSVGRDFVTMSREILDPVRQSNIEAAKKKQPFFDLVKKAVREEGWTEITDPAVVREAVSARSRTQGSFGNLTPLLLRWMLMALGYADRCDRPGLSMVRS